MLWEMPYRKPCHLKRRAKFNKKRVKRIMRSRPKRRVNLRMKRRSKRRPKRRPKRRIEAIPIISKNLMSNKLNLKS